MRSAVIMAIISGVLLALFLLIRPYIGGIGDEARPDISGRALTPVPSGAVSGSAGAGNPATLTPPPSNVPNSRPSAADAMRVGISHMEGVERLILRFTNEERAKVPGLKPLAIDDTMLRDSARGHSDDMLYRRFFDHTDPDGLDQSGRIALVHRRLISRSTGENILKMSGYDPSNPEQVAREMMYGDDGWMNSPGHKKNILDPDYTHIGVGVSLLGREIRATQNFAHAKAFTDQPLPSVINNGGNVGLMATNLDGQKAEQYDYWLTDKGMKACEPISVSDGTVKIGPGVYKIRFYFRSQGNDGFTIYWGPQVEVR